MKNQYGGYVLASQLRRGSGGIKMTSAIEQVNTLIKSRDTQHFNGIRNITLEEQLEALFYNNSANEKEAKTYYGDIINGIAEEYVQEILNKVQNVNLGELIKRARSEARDAVKDTAARASLSAQGNDLINKIIKSIDVLSSKIEKGSDIETTLAQISKMAKSAEKTIEKYRALYNTDGKLKENGQFRTKENKRRIALSYKDEGFVFLKTSLILLDYLDNLIHVLPDSYKMGEKLEKAMVEAVNNLTNRNTSNLSNHLSKGIAERTGDKIVSRNSVKGSDVTLYASSFKVKSTSSNDENTKKLINNINSYYKENNYSITVAGDEKQSKMDVLVTFPDAGEYRMSLKNWGNSLRSNDRFGIGESSLLRAITRSAGAASVSNYALAIMSSTNKGDLASAHRLAKLAIAADIMMGASQNSGFAEQLVIHNRSGKKGSHFRVFNMPYILENIFNELQPIIFEGYPNENDSMMFHDYSYNVNLGRLGKRSPGRTKLYLARQFAMLNSQMVKIKLNPTYL